MKKLLKVFLSFILCLQIAGALPVAAESDEFSGPIPAEPAEAEIEEASADEGIDETDAEGEDETETPDAERAQDEQAVSLPEEPVSSAAVTEIETEDRVQSEEQLLPSEEESEIVNDAEDQEEAEAVTPDEPADKTVPESSEEIEDAEETDETEEISEEIESSPEVLNASYNFGVECPQWRLSKVGDGALSSEDYKDRVQLLVFYKALLKEDCAVCGSSRAAMETLTSSGWIADNKIKVIFVEANYAQRDEVNKFISIYSNNNTDVEYCYNGVKFMFDLCRLTGYPIKSFAAGVIIKDNQIVDMFDGYAYQEDFYERLKKYADINVPVSGVSLYPSQIEINTGDTSILEATVLPVNASNRNVAWTSSNTKVATVDKNGKVTAKAAGTATITVKTADGGKKATCKVTVANNPYAVQSVKLNKTSVTLSKGMGIMLTATVSPFTAVNQDVTWSSSNPKVATVDTNGIVMAKAAGTAVITVKTVDGGKKATCKVIVKKDPAACKMFGFCRNNGKDYWYENGIRQAVKGDPKNLIDIKYHVERGREIYDPDTKAWYWLDAAYDGAKAEGKEVWMPYIYQDEDKWSYADKDKLAAESDPGMAYCVLNAMLNKDGKWVRYDQDGKMLKGWVTITGELAKIYPEQNGNTYYYDNRTGLMAKGWVNLEGKWRHFDEVTGKLLN